MNKLIEVTGERFRERMAPLSDTQGYASRTFWNPEGSQVIDICVDAILLARTEIAESGVRYYLSFEKLGISVDRMIEDLIEDMDEWDRDRLLEAAKNAQLARYKRHLVDCEEEAKDDIYEEWSALPPANRSVK